MSSNLQNSIWPNAEGTLGQNKVEIPDGITTQWPDGDALVDNFIYKDGELVGFVDNKALINNSSKTSNINYDYVRLHLENIGEGDVTFTLSERCKNFTVTYGSTFAEEVFKYKGCTTVDEVKAVDPDYLTNDIVDGVWTESLGDLIDGNSNDSYSGGMFYKCRTLTEFSSNLSSLTDAYGMFYYCENLTTFSTDLSNLTNGNSMFHDCTNLTTFNSDLSKLTNSFCMFRNCSALTSFSSNLSSLTDAYGMFYYCENLTTFSSNLSSLTNSTYMFWGCHALTSFSSDLSSLKDGGGMFLDCSAFTSFSSDLSSLTSGYGMFQGCKLDIASVQNIADTINTVTNNPIIHIGVEDEYGKQIYFEQIRQKGWDVLVSIMSNCSCCATCCASLTTLDETGGEFVAPKPYWAKPVPATEETAEYIDEQGNFYNILGGDYIYVHDPETYGMFTSREDAIANMRLKRIGEEEIETA